MIKFKIGEKVKLKDYKMYSDYKKHDGQRAIIVELVEEEEFYCRVSWRDDQTSRVKLDNLIKIKTVINKNLTLEERIKQWKETTDLWLYP